MTTRTYLPCGHRAWLIRDELICPNCSQLAGAGEITGEQQQQKAKAKRLQYDHDTVRRRDGLKTRASGRPCGNDYA